MKRRFRTNITLSTETRALLGRLSKEDRRNRSNMIEWLLLQEKRKRDALNRTQEVSNVA